MQVMRNPGAMAGNRGDLFRTAVVAGVVFLLWKAARGAMGLAWAAFGLAMAVYWTGFRPW